MDMKNLTILNEEQLMEKNRTANKQLEDAKSKAHTIQIELTTLNKELHNLSSKKKDVLSLCMWERKEDEKLRVMMEELKLTHSRELGVAKKIQGLTDVKAILEQKALKVELDFVHKSKFWYQIQVVDFKTQIGRL